MTRLFVALWPPDEVREELRQLHRKDQRGVRFVPEDNWHVTLRFLGEADVDECLIEAGDRPMVHLLMRTVAAMQPHHSGLIAEAV